MLGAVQTLEAAGFLLSLTGFYSLSAECCLVAGLVDDGALYADKAMEHSRSGEKVGVTTALRAMAMAAAHDNPPDWAGVDTHMGQSIRLSRESGERPYLSLARFRYAECLHKKGDLDAAREQLDQADALFRDMGMDWWTEQAEGLRGRIGRGEPFKWFAPYVDGPPKAE